MKTSFHNIYSDKIVHVIICPSHQLKNMIAALNSSRDLGTKLFTLENSTFGWSQIVNMYKRELQRAENNEIRRVPDLLANHIYKDKWTRLNVKAAKIMQQNHVLAELKEYFENHKKDKRLMNTIQYLDACNKLFERGQVWYLIVSIPDLCTLTYFTYCHMKKFQWDRETLSS